MKLEEILPEIRKGRRFKRTHWGRWWSLEGLKVSGLVINDEDIGVTDWELEPEYITLKVTEKEFLEAFKVRRFAGDIFDYLKKLSEGR